VRAFLIAIALALGGCASNSSDYARTDGVPVDPMHQQATLAQCKGEAATTPSGNTAGLLPSVKRASDENTIINACMARNGYIQAQAQ